MLTRHTTMVVGPTQGGKSVVIETLARGLGKGFKIPTKLFQLNPKALAVSELYGTLDMVTRDWTDGLLSKMFRDLNEPLREDQKENRYIVFDGDVDALWVENMNSVMDDSKMLTLPNGERIRLQEHVKLLFEVGDLQYASPATISRCGMVFVDPQNLGYEPYFFRYTMTLFEGDFAAQDAMFAFFTKYLPPCIDFGVYGVVDGKSAEGGALDFIIPLTDCAMVRQLCNLFESITEAYVAERKNVLKEAATTAREALLEAGEVPEENAIIDDMNRPKLDGDAEDMLESVFVFCLMWSVGGGLTADSRARFDAFVKQISNRQCVGNASRGQLPEDSIYDFNFPMDDPTNAR
jgi:dynein heavy chain